MYQARVSFQALTSLLRTLNRVLIVGSDPRSLAVGESKWDAKRENFTLPKIDLPHNLYDNFIIYYVQYYIIIKID
jgi:hypothetical protein